MANEYEDNVRLSIWQSISRPRLSHWSPWQGVRDSRCLPSNMLLFFAHQILNFGISICFNLFFLVSGILSISISGRSPIYYFEKTLKNEVSITFKVH